MGNWLPPPVSDPSQHYQKLTIYDCSTSCLIRELNCPFLLGGFCNANVNFVDNTVISFGQKVAGTSPYYHKIA
ncbi:hypothetical protein CUJ84_Chr002178 [Rhizobium leguminosarum]|uniref:Uncharacterized protein n=1 Tax=Rhizobium leguminosarum TaxID=384 RepID=A0A2K9Z2T1_RHILE|nr:hypothetical protein CUJ84_Chr002178 [Rhizobium leguminosarum]